MFPNFKMYWTWLIGVKQHPIMRCVISGSVLATVFVVIWYDTSIKVQKGTKLRVIAHYDNSPNNKFNPDPSKTVYYGNQTWEEMHFPAFGVVVDDLSLDQRKVLTRTPPPGAN